MCIVEKRLTLNLNEMISKPSRDQYKYLPVFFGEIDQIYVCCAQLILCCS